jgi:hypothetical protein
MQRTLALVVAFQGLAGPLRAQDEAALRSYFEGRTVIVKVAMPAAEAGIDVDGLRADREREDRRNRAIATAATERRREYIQERRLQGGSRFNLRYPSGVPAEAITVQAVEAALAEYVDFGSDEPAAPAGPPPAEPAPAGPLALRKGMPAEDVDQLLGAPTHRAERREGTLSVQARTYDTASGRVVAEFVEGVLVRFTITSR